MDDTYELVDLETRLTGELGMNELDPIHARAPMGVSDMSLFVLNELTDALETATQLPPSRPT